MKIAFVFNERQSSSVDEAEFDTRETVGSIANALASGGHDVQLVPMTRDDKWISELRRLEPQLVFNTAEGYKGVGRESYGPVVFEQLGIPYVGPGPYVCFLTLDKFLTKRVVAQSEVPVVEGYFVTKRKDLEEAAKSIVFPAFVKPNYEGSSKGITQKSLCRTYLDLVNYGKECLTAFPEGIIIERFIPGKDVSIGYIAGVGRDGVLDPVEYEVVGASKAGEWIYDYDYKNFKDEQVKAVCPALIGDELTEKMKSYMKDCVDALGIVDIGRADFRVTPDGELFFMEFNALPSLQPGAGMFEATKRLGLSYEQTIQQILEAAISRMKLAGKSSRPSHKMNFRKPRVAVVYNLKRKKKNEEGFEQEAEFDSQTTIDALVGAVRSLGHETIPLEANKDIAEELQDQNINIVFNIAEGIASRAREAQVPAICDLLGIEHTGSDATSLSITLDKAISKRLVAAEGVLTPKSLLFARPPKRLKKELDLQYPLIVKPNYEGTSKGISRKSVVSNEEEFFDAVNRLYAEIPEPILVEEYIQGREFTIGVFGNSTLKVLGPLEIQFKETGDKYPVYSLEAKIQEEAEDNRFLKLVCPVLDLDKSVERQIHASAKKVFRVLGCRDVARVDFRLNQRNQVYFLEANPLPGLSPGFSDLAILADRLGWGYEKMIKTILDPAIQRWRASLKQRAQGGGDEREIVLPPVLTT